MEFELKLDMSIQKMIMIMSNYSIGRPKPRGGYHVQHDVCHVTRRDSSAIEFDRVEMAVFPSSF